MISSRAADGSTVTFGGDASEYLSSKDIKPLTYPPEWGEPDVQKYFEPYNKYTLNSYLYRSPEFKSGVDLICSGCSQTYGIGVPDDGTWPSFVAKDLNASYVNLSAPGASIEWIVFSILKYIHTFGRPKKGILIFFPDMLRGEVAVNGTTTCSKEWGTPDFVQSAWNDEARTVGVISHQSVFGYSIPKLLKKPYEIEYTISKEEAFRKSLRAIQTLEMYCKETEIPLLWGSWGTDVNYLGEHHPELFENYIDLQGMRDWASANSTLEKTEDDPEGIADYKISHREDTLEQYGCKKEWGGTDQCVCKLNCHPNLQEKFALSFHLATDRYKENNEGNAHMGVHKLRHIADDYVAALKDIK